MIPTNALSVFILHHNPNGLQNKNLRSLQDIIRSSELEDEKYKRVCKDCPNLIILTKSATPGKVRLTFVHADI